MDANEVLSIAVQHHQAGRFAQAEPMAAKSLQLMALVAVRKGRPDEAIELLGRAIATEPNKAELHFESGVVWELLNKLTEAIAAYREAIRLNPAFIVAYLNLGRAFLRASEAPAALTILQHLIQTNPDLAAAYFEMGLAHTALSNVPEAKNAFAHAVALKPDYSEAHNNLGSRLCDEGKLAEAMESFRKAIASNPNNWEAHSNLCGVLRDLAQLDEAIQFGKKAVQLNPQSAVAHHNLAGALKESGLLDEAVLSMRTALALQPRSASTHSSLIVTMNYLSQTTTAELFSESRRWERQHAQSLEKFAIPHRNDASPNRPLRVGYVSGDFREHACACFLAPLLRFHDRREVRIFCYAQVVKPDAVTREMQNDHDQWRFTPRLTDEQLIELIRDDRIDILIDCMGHFGHHRLLAMARKPAPVQATWMGYVGTTGLASMDYRITDPYLHPVGVEDEYYSEQSIRLPDCFRCYDPRSSEPAVNPLPALTRGDVTFGSFGAFVKINEPLLRLWADVLNAVPDSRLCMQAPEGTARERVVAFLESLGIVRRRIEFAGKESRRNYLALYHRIDIVLDTLPYNGHTTGLDALWMGVPVITMRGNTPVGRVGLGHAMNLNLPSLVARSPVEYVQIARNLAADLPRLAGLRSTLRSRMKESPLMDGPRFARNMESAYRTMWRRWCAEKSQAD
jgi:predicted O-linked N-acetylglucosamine transferase (SPINDLY family)